MRHRSFSQSNPPANQSTRNDWATLKTLLPYLWEWKWRVIFAMACLVMAKMANVGIPMILKEIVDSLTVSPQSANAVLVLPMALLVAYGLLRLSTTAFTELREFFFARVTQRAVRNIALKVFRHLHALSLRFHLNRQTGGVTRDIERGTRGISTLISYTLFSILPTLVEISLVLGYLSLQYDIWFSVITITALSIYILFTVFVTEWRTNFRRTMNDLDSKANVRAIDSLLNYETVKYFGNEEYEARRYDEGLQRFERAAVQSQNSLSLLNTGQSLIIATAVTLILWRATLGVIAGTMTLGDLVLVNAFMIQLYIPLNLHCSMKIGRWQIRQRHLPYKWIVLSWSLSISTSATRRSDRSCLTLTLVLLQVPPRRLSGIVALANRHSLDCYSDFMMSIVVQS